MPNRSFFFGAMIYNTVSNYAVATRNFLCLSTKVFGFASNRLVIIMYLCHTGGTLQNLEGLLLHISGT